MKERTKMKLKFYASLVGIVGLTVYIGVIFQYLAWVSWQVRHGFMPPKYGLFWVMAIVLFILCITDIVLFFRLIIQKRYW